MFTTTIRERCMCGALDCVACRGKAAVAAYLASEREECTPECDGCGYDAEQRHPWDGMLLCADCLHRATHPACDRCERDDRAVEERLSGRVLCEKCDDVETEQARERRRADYAEGLADHHHAMVRERGVS